MTWNLKLNTNTFVTNQQEFPKDEGQRQWQTTTMTTENPKMIFQSPKCKCEAYKSLNVPVILLSIIKMICIYEIVSFFFFESAKFIRLG